MEATPRLATAAGATNAVALLIENRPRQHSGCER
jgi:hypothetical protein